MAQRWYATFRRQSSEGRSLVESGVLDEHPVTWAIRESADLLFVMEAPDDVEVTHREKPKWVVNDIGELGVEIGGHFYFMYKGRPLEYDDPRHDDDGSPMLYRPVYKREFGEVCRPRDWWPRCEACRHVQCNYPGRYTFGDDEDWKPLPVLKTPVE